jgi:hypothetical protein
VAEFKLEVIQPRTLKYRSHYRVYLLLFFAVFLSILSFWSYKFTHYTLAELYTFHKPEFYFTCFYFVSFIGCYFFWLRQRLNQAVQVHHSYVKLINGNVTEELHFEDIQSIGTVWRSVFYLKMNNGFKYFFSSSLERIDYVWDGIKTARPELMEGPAYDAFRKHLIQYDHHQKRKDWFFRHKLVDIFNWVLLPVLFMVFAYAIQSKEMLIHQQGLYFFRLFLYSMLICLSTSFFYSMILKIWVFDKHIEVQLDQDQNHKTRNLDYEGVIIHRSKIFQFITACFMFAIVVKTDLNMFSYARVKDQVGAFNIKAGSSHFVDNRYNCSNCKFRLQDGDLVFYGKGTVGQVLALEGDLIAKVGKVQGREIASEAVSEVPRGFAAIRGADNKIMFVKLQDLIGKLQK